MNIISSSYGNDSIAMIQWAVENNLDDVIVVYIDTGWAGVNWPERVATCERWVKSNGFKAITITPKIQFAELIKQKSGFPNQRYQWCSAMLKGLPFLNWIDDNDPDGVYSVFVGKRRDESKSRTNTPCITYSEYHGGRMLVHPLFLHTVEDRNKLLDRAGFGVLPHRSLECDPCVNANRSDFVRLHGADIEKAAKLEDAVGKTMFRPARHQGAAGVKEVVTWAKAGRGAYKKLKNSLEHNCEEEEGNDDSDDDDPYTTGCGSPFGCGL
jgi:3'-phosphoadenosine 5'-phosphosulfate sulfotransferase (PAPS reductase)/FAD synthetase